MVDKNSNDDYRRMSERWGKESADMICKMSEQNAQRKAELEKQHKQFALESDKKMRERWGDNITDLFDKLEKESNSRYGDMFTKATYSLGEDTSEAVSKETAQKVYNELKEKYQSRFDELFGYIENAAKIKTLTPLNNDCKEIALKIGMELLQERYRDYFNKK